MKKIRVAIIGAGQIARTSHIPAYRKMEDVEITAVCDTRPESAEKLAQEFDIPEFYGDARAMLEKCGPDAVSICVPNRFHSELAILALSSGADVICEKPPAVTVREAAAMADAAKKYGRLLTYGFHLRFGENVRMLKQRIDAGDLGQIYAAEAVWLRRRGIPGWGNFTNKAVQGGGPLIDLGAHVLDLAVYLMNYPDVGYVCADMSDRIGRSGHHGFFGDWDPAKYTVEDGLFGQIHFQNGSVLRVDTSFALNMKEKNVRNVRVFGDRCGAGLFPFEIWKSSDSSGTYDEEFVTDDRTDLHETELMHFIAACRGEEELLVTPEQGVYVQRLIDALYRSAESGRPVEFGD